MSKYWSDFVATLDPYTPGEQPAVQNLTKLNTNENPYPPSPRVLAAMQQTINGNVRLRSCRIRGYQALKGGRFSAQIRTFTFA